jgi:predicted nucleotide-binding protein
VDLTEEQLRERFLQPYESGEPILINGKTILPDDIERVRISRSQESSTALIAAEKAEDRGSSVFFLGGPSYEWRAADRANDVTDEFIRGPAGYKLSQAPNAQLSRTRSRSPRSRVKRSMSSKKVFVIHGHDHALKADLEVFLHNIGLEPIVLHRQPDGGQTLIEKIEKHADVGYAIVLMTPDDIAFSATEIQAADADRHFEPRARQNVIFEFGYFAAQLGRERVCCIIRSGVAFPSDLNGFVYKEVRESIEDIGYPLIRELKDAGMKPTIK